MRAALGLPAAASFKHVSPAGAAVAAPLSEAEADACVLRRSASAFPQARETRLPGLRPPPSSYEVGSADRPAVQAAAALSPLALAYVRARNADPMCSFGNFIALSDVVDVSTAEVIKREVADGVIAPGFEPEALAILAAKKGGSFICLRANSSYTPPALEYREVRECLRVLKVSVILRQGVMGLHTSAVRGRLQAAS